MQKVRVRYRRHRSDTPARVSFGKESGWCSFFPPSPPLFKASDGEMRGGLFVILSRAQDARAKVKEDKRVNICAME